MFGCQSLLKTFSRLKKLQKGKIEHEEYGRLQKRMEQDNSFPIKSLIC